MRKTQCVSKERDLFHHMKENCYDFESKIKRRKEIRRITERWKKIAYRKTGNNNQSEYDTRQKWNKKWNNVE